jgi:hypothetical protein
MSLVKVKPPLIQYHCCCSTERRDAQDKGHSGQRPLLIEADGSDAAKTQGMPDGGYHQTPREYVPEDTLMSVLWSSEL